MHCSPLSKYFLGRKYFFGFNCLWLRKICWWELFVRWEFCYVENLFWWEKFLGWEFNFGFLYTIVQCALCTVCSVNSALYTVCSALCTVRTQTEKAWKQKRGVYEVWGIWGAYCVWGARQRERSCESTKGESGQHKLAHNALSSLSPNHHLHIASYYPLLFSYLNIPYRLLLSSQFNSPPNWLFKGFTNCRFLCIHSHFIHPCYLVILSKYVA